MKVAQVFFLEVILSVDTLTVRLNLFLKLRKRGIKDDVPLNIVDLNRR